MYFAQTVLFDWLPGDMKGKILKKKKKINKKFPHITHKGMKLKLGIHSQDISRLYINCVYCSGRIRTLVVMEAYYLHRLIMGKLNIDIFSCLNGDICNIFLQGKFIE